MQTNNASEDPVQPQRSNPWFDDGNLVLEAENTQFRIHRGVICASSTVFKDMFGLDQLVSGDETVEGCPVVQLSDSAADLQHVLKAIYSRGYEVPESALSSLPIISAFLRLGKKYDISRLYNEAMTMLRRRCPTTLESYDKTVAEIAPSAFYVQVVNLALETDTSSLIPAALSLCLRGSSLTNIASGSPRGSGSNTYFLLPEGLRMACLGRERLQQTALRSFVPPCGPDSPCAVRALRALILIELQVQRTISLEPWGEKFEEGFELCSRCTDALRKHWMDKRKKAWDELPSSYGLPPWEKLL